MKIQTLSTHKIILLLFMVMVINLYSFSFYPRLISGIILLCYSSGLMLQKKLFTPDTTIDEPSNYIKNKYFLFTKSNKIDCLFVSIALSICINSFFYYIFYSLFPAYVSHTSTAILPVIISLIIFLLPTPATQNITDKTRSLSEGFLIYIIMAIAGFLFFYDLSYSDFSLDESYAVVYRAQNFLTSTNPSILFAGVRPPGQIIIATIINQLIGSYDPMSLRAVFAICNLSAVWCFYTMGKESKSPTLGLCLAGLCLLDSFMIAFARTIQFQSLGYMSLSYSAYFMWQYCASKQTEYNKPHSFMLSCLFFAYATLTHYECWLFLPVIIFGCAYNFKQIKQSKYLMITLLGMLTISASYYLPMYLRVGTNYSGLFRGRLDGGFPHFNYGILFYYWQLSSSFSKLLISLSVVYVIFTIYELIWSKEKNKLLDYIALCWFIPTFTCYIIIMARPFTHIALFIHPWKIFAAIALCYIADIIKQRKYASVIAFAAILYCASLAKEAWIYNYNMYISTKNDLKKEPPNCPNLFRKDEDGSPCAQSLKNSVHFGLPNQRGYDIVAYLYATGFLQGSLTCNERTEVCATSMGNKPHVTDYKYQAHPDNIVIVSNPPTLNHTNLWRQAFDSDKGYKLNVIVYIKEQPIINVYSLKTSMKEPIELYLDKNQFKYRELMAQKTLK